MAHHVNEAGEIARVRAAAREAAKTEKAVATAAVKTENARARTAARETAKTAKAVVTAARAKVNARALPLTVVFIAIVVAGLFLAPLSAGAQAASNSGLIYNRYTVYGDNSNRVLSSITEGQTFDILVEFRVPDGITLGGSGGSAPTLVSVVGDNFIVTGGGGDQEMVIAGDTASVRLKLVYDGGSRQLVLILRGLRSLESGEFIEFDDERVITVRECEQSNNSGGGTPAIPPQNEVNPPRVIIDTSARFSTANGGSAYKLTVPLRNAGKVVAKDITISIEPGEGSTDFPFEYDKQAFTATVSEIKVNDLKSVSLDVKTLSTAREGTVPITFKIVYSSVFGGPPIEASETVTINVANRNTAPKLTVTSTNTGSEAVKPGSDFTLQVRIQNIGTLGARGVKLTLKGLKSDTVTNNSSDIKYTRDISGRSSLLETFDLHAAPGLSVERVELALGIEYKDQTGNDYSDESIIFLPIEGAAPVGHSEIEFIDMSGPSGTLREGANFRVGFDLRNSGEAELENLVVTYTAGSEFIGKTLNTMTVKELMPGESRSFTFDFSVSKDATTGNSPIGFTVEYSTRGADAETPRTSASQYIGVQLYNEPSATTTTTTEEPTEQLKDSVPKIIISTYSYEPKEAMAGQEVEVSLTFFNTSVEQQVRNIKVSLDSAIESSGTGSAGGIFTPVEGSNTFYISEMAPLASVERSIRLYIKADAEPKSYPLISDIEYEDSKNNPVTAKESISIPVNQVTRVMIGEISYNTPEMFVGQGAGFFFQFINMGKTTLYNVMVTTEGPFEQQAERYFAGNLQSGMSDFYDGVVVPMEAGEVTGYVVVSYEDATGMEHEERAELVLNVMDMGGGMEMGDWDMMGGEWGGRGEIMFGPDGMPMDADMMGEEPGGFRGFLNWFLKPVPIICSAVGLLASIITVVALVKRRKKRRLERELEAEDEL